uniref:Uncharacterized protein n=1 Tax=Fundulus heteroclitus TaxID=8078 RepID=A0A146T2M6_FUNHE
MFTNFQQLRSGFFFVVVVFLHNFQKLSINLFYLHQNQSRSGFGFGFGTIVLLELSPWNNHLKEWNPKEYLLKPA